MRSAAFLFVCATGLALVAPLLSGDDPSQYDPAAATTRQDEIELLKAQVRLQQEQIDELRKRLAAQQNLLQGIHSAGAVTPAPVLASSPTQHPAGPALRGSAPVTAPLSFELGGATITPTGFVDFSQVWRSKAVTSGLPTNFAAIPFNNTVLGHRRQTVSSAANSRLGMQINTRVLGFDVLGLVETDFQGYVPNNVATTSNSYGLRLRLAFADLRKNRWEFLVGQNWSLMTPARKGIDPLPDTLFLTQDLDPNIQSGLVWARNPQSRVVFHASRSIATGVSFKAGDLYAGGSAGAGTITLPDLDLRSCGPASSRLWIHGLSQQPEPDHSGAHRGLSSYILEQPELRDLSVRRPIGWSGILGLWRQASQRAPTLIWFILDSDIFFLGCRSQGEAILTNNETRQSWGDEKSSAVVSHCCLA